ncbi:helix-turn-helix domain-containing protein [Roseomonas marmotae]|uniref:Helix-turn-helix domain-containing protein n=1 Tax=Roseomonas marmotae TaxID=2768161 RepID=A0ABS3KGZ2_9PROT|nr:helix-turn-helix domain-containing protein [Roseomonas marmotae]MBO1076753.1 helix-turn-helix domain-containing protein [Roseomonas marmotae]QTI77996.1 helix-turn-helix domain-containing protein [Roseomonas marmotae]
MKRHPRPETSAEAVRVGEELRDARLASGLSLEEAEDRLRINRRYLAALEEGRVRDLPGVTYATGFIRSYAQMLGLDASEMVRRFREGAGVAAASKDLVFPEPVPERGIPAGAIMMVGAVLAVAGYAGWYYWSGSSQRTVDVVPALPPRLEQSAREAGAPPLPGAAMPGSAGQALPPGTSAVTGATPRINPPPATALPPAALPPGTPPAGPVAGFPATVPAPAPVTAPAPAAGQPRPEQPAPPAGSAVLTPEQPAPAAPEPPPLTAAEPATPAASGIVLRATEDAWVQIRDTRTGRTVLSRILRPKETYEVPEGGNLILTTGRIEGLAIEVDGKPSAASQGLVGVRRDILLDPARLRDAEPGQLPTR